MHSAAVVLIGLLALLHFYFLVLEMFLWTKPSGMTRPEVSQSVAVFFLTCVVIAGFYGAYSTKNKKILFIQSAPAIVALALVVGNR